MGHPARLHLQAAFVLQPLAQWPGTPAGLLNRGDYDIGLLGRREPRDVHQDFEVLGAIRVEHAGHHQPGHLRQPLPHRHVSSTAISRQKHQHAQASAPVPSPLGGTRRHRRAVLGFNGAVRHWVLGVGREQARSRVRHDLHLHGRVPRRDLHVRHCVLAAVVPDDGDQGVLDDARLPPLLLRPDSARNRRKLDPRRVRHDLRHQRYGMAVAHDLQLGVSPSPHRSGHDRPAQRAGDEERRRARRDAPYRWRLPRPPPASSRGSRRLGGAHRR